MILHPQVKDRLDDIERVVINTMLQQIALGADPQSAWQDTVNKLGQTVANWKSIHPTWSSKDCRGNAAK